MTKIHFDYETFSEEDLIKRGMDRYVRHDTTEVLMLGYAFDDDEPSIWLPHEERMPKEVRDALTLKGITKYAHNAAFEINVTRHVLGLDTPQTEWRCTQIMAYYCSMPGALKKLGPILRLPEEMWKDEDGQRLIRMFSIPQKPTKKQPLKRLDWNTHPEDFQKFVGYCRQDVVAEREVEKRLSKFDLPDHEWQNWHLDRVINERGYPIDVEFAKRAHQAFVFLRDRTVKKLNSVTGMPNSKSATQMLEYARSVGYQRTSMRSDTVKKALHSDGLNPELVNLLKDYQRAVSTNPAKYQTMLKCELDGILRNCIQFMGAQRTHRYAGRTVQFQNVKRPSKAFEDPDYTMEARQIIKDYHPRLLPMLFDDPMDTVVSLIRSTVHARPGRVFNVADLSSIENVGLGYLARCEKTMQEFRDGLDPYLAFAVYLFDRPYEELYAEFKAGDKSARSLAKPGKLGAGYRLGGGELKGGDRTGLWGYAESLGVDMERDMAHKSIKIYREAYPAVVQFWYDLENAAKKIITGREKSVRVGHVVFDSKGPFMRIRMPNGSYLHYLRPRIEEKETPWGAMKPTITFEGLDSYTNKWKRLKTHGGSLAENVTQKFARDILCNGLQLCEEENLYVIGHVHDEAISEDPVDREDALQTLIKCLTTPPSWASDIPLSASGYSLPFYTKD